MDSRRSKTLYVIAGTIVTAVVPLAIFPSMFGQELLRASWRYVLYEAVLYGLVGTVVFRCNSLIGVLKVAVLSLAFRLVAGAAFGLVIISLFSMDFRVAMTLAQISYWPGVAVQIFLTPFALYPVLKAVVGDRNVPRREPIRTTAVPSARTPFPAAPVRERSDAVHVPLRPREVTFPQVPTMHPRMSGESPAVSASGDLNGFDRAVRYVAEHGSVYFVAVVDQEGLLLANHCRSRLDPEDVAPLAVTFLEWNREILSKGRFGEAEKIDITLKEKRLILGRVGDWCMMVLSERVADDLLNIRVNQGLDMLKKYWLERQGSGRQNEVEKAYV